MPSQEVQTLTGLFRNCHGLCAFPENLPRVAAFVCEDGTPLRLLGFNEYFSPVPLGKRTVAGFGAANRPQPVSFNKEIVRQLAQSCNAVLFTWDCGRYKVEVLEQITSRTIFVSENATFRFRRTGMVDTFIPRG